MKTIPTMIAASLLVVSVSATADSANDTLVTEVVPTHEAAYQLGVNKLSVLKNSSSFQLSYLLNTPLGDIEDGSLRLKDGAFITVEERMNADGKLGYVGQVNVSVNYEMHESDD